MSSHGSVTAQRAVSDYLRQVQEATARLSPDARNELLTQLEEHIREARAGLDDGDVDGVRAILDSLGTPEQIAAAAYNEPAAAPGGRTTDEKRYDLITVLLLAVGAVCVPVVGWLAGVYLLWKGPRWTLRDRLLGTLIWPLGPAGLMMVNALLPTAESVEFCTPEPHPVCTVDSAPRAWLGYLAVGPFVHVILLLGTLLVCLYLAWRAGRHDSRTA